MRKFKDLVGIDYDRTIKPDGDSEERYLETDKKMRQFERNFNTMHDKLIQFIEQPDNEPEQPQVPEEHLALLQNMISKMVNEYSDSDDTDSDESFDEDQKNDTERSPEKKSKDYDDYTPVEPFSADW